MATRIIIISLIVSACSSGKIACPEIRSDKLRMTVIRPNQLKKKTDEEQLSVSTKYRPSDFKPRTDLKKAEFIEEWDCPQASKIQKMAKQQKRRMDRQLKLERKKRRQMDSLTTVIPSALRYRDRGD